MWIEKKNMGEYDDGPLKGLRLNFKEGIKDECKKEIINFVRWLRKLFWFPVRCNVVFYNQLKFHSATPKKYCYGIFSSNEEVANITYKKRPPIICIPCGSKIINLDIMADYFFALIHELTHYFQWYFFEDEKRSSRSLEIEANRWGDYLTHKYIDEILSKRDNNILINNC